MENILNVLITILIVKNFIWNPCLLVLVFNDFYVLYTDLYTVLYTITYNVSNSIDNVFG